MNPSTSRSIAKQSLLALGATAASSSGAIVHSTVNAGEGIAVTPGNTIYLNVLTSTVSLASESAPGYQFQISPIAGVTTNPAKFQVGHSNGSTLGYTGVAQKIEAGQLIDSSLTFTTTNFRSFTDGSTGGWSLGERGYYAFGIPNESATNYGWLELEFSGSTGTPQIKLLSYAYEDSGAGLIAGQTIPEPSAPVLLTGCAAVFAARRRRKAMAA